MRFLGLFPTINNDAWKATKIVDYLSLTKAITSLVDILTACKRLLRLCVVAVTLDSENPELSYSTIW